VCRQKIIEEKIRRIRREKEIEEEEEKKKKKRIESERK